MQKRSNKSREAATSNYDELDAVRDISAILEMFGAPERERVLRWVRERLDMDSVQEILPEKRVEVVRPAAVVKPSRLLRNPHEMAKPPLNKLIVQDDDDEGAILGVPADKDLAEPEGIDLVKPKGPARQLVTKKFKDGSTAVVLAK